MPFGNKDKKYWIIPQESLAPEHLGLGSILKRPNDPIDILNRGAIEPLSESEIIREREQVTKSLDNAVSSGFGSKLGASSVLAAVVGASPSLEGSWKNATSVSFQATGVRAQHFVPEADYVNRALRTKRVDLFVRRSFFTAPVYMVVGIAIAQTLKRESAISSERGAGAGVGLGPPGTGVEVSAEFSANNESKSSNTDSVENEVILAYRVRRFRYSKRKDEFVKRDEDETKPAHYTLGEDEDEDEEEGQIPVFSFFEEDDIAAQDIGMEGFVDSSQ
ncbi:hypothetical protein B0I35DRAFT_423615 [Stachybotrys elegans]|uniref:Uncharacterized protein n=1 Tax=Stachybotrys elegans TaxID=80388 RepID=A0A8K0T211_9HYPO|nr:hypothetical protein B0I35DRAFT_423615 [Stachybotrys elegans]